MKIERKVWSCEGSRDGVEDTHCVTVKLGAGLFAGLTTERPDVDLDASIRRFVDLLAEEITGSWVAPVTVVISLEDLSRDKVRGVEIVAYPPANPRALDLETTGMIVDVAIKNLLRSRGVWCVTKAELAA